ncbi:MAG: endolytic transglycosylase MltG [Gammaproteobacteria bacterium]|nr:MAG: endolytic transglycosylase MltG [Gammaproteobacteria bacterium]
MKIFFKTLLYAVPTLGLMFLFSSSWLIEDYKKWTNLSNDTAKETIVIVKESQIARDVYQELSKKNLLDSSLYFYILARFDNQNEQIKHGEFTIPPYSTPRQIYKTLTTSQKKQYSFTIVEGKTVKTILENLSQRSNIKHTLLTDKKQEQTIKELGIKKEKLEGLFLAETYFYSKNNTDISVLKRANSDLNKFLEQQWQKRSDNLPYKNSYEALIMASIIEKETGVADERALIAGVFVNRLNIKMRLQTDPTVIYGMGDKYKGDIRYKDLKEKTAYNTYVINGLPPTPIAIASKASIIAALNPKKTQALYFVASGGGRHKFSNNLKDHNKAVQQYLRNSK